MQLGLFQREITPDSVLAALQARIGAANGMTAAQLSESILGRHGAADERRLRTVVEHLRRQGHAVCAHPSHGYFMAANADELDQTCEFLLGRAMTSLQQISALKHTALPDLRGQLGLPLQTNPRGNDDESVAGA
jgi:hypothetical protein